MQPLTDGTEAKLFRLDLSFGNPKISRGIIGSMDDRKIADLTTIEHIQRVNIHATVTVKIRDTEEIVDMRHVKARLLFHLADHSRLTRLIHIDEATGEVESPFAGIILPADNEELTLLVLDEGYRGTTRIGIIDKSAVLTTLTLLIILYKMGRAADRTEFEMI